MRARHAAEFFRAENAGEAHEVLHRVFVGAAGVPVADVGEPLDLGRNVGQPVKLLGGQQAFVRGDLGRQMRSLMAIAATSKGCSEGSPLFNGCDTQWGRTARVPIKEDLMAKKPGEP